MEAFVYTANFLYLFSYMVKDILHLRLLTIVAACCLVTYFYNQDEPMMTVVYWNVFFIALNIFQLTRIYLERPATDGSGQASDAGAEQADAEPVYFKILSDIAGI